MKSNRFAPIACAFLLAVAAGTAVASAAPSQTPAEIVSYQKAIRAKVDAHQGEYATLSTEARNNITQAQDKIFQMLDGVQSLDQLSPEQKTALSNELDRVKSGLVANDGSRMICHIETPIGSNIAKKRCETVAEREARSRDTQRDLQDLNALGRNSLISGH